MAAAITVEPYQESDAAAWDDLVARSANGTLLHSRRYLGYHGARFEDRSLFVFDGGKPVAVVPAAVDPADARRIVTHPGITYGGLVHLPTFRGSSVIAAVEGCLASWGADRVVYKPVPRVFHRVPAEDDQWALSSLGATRVRCDLAWALDLSSPMSWSGNRRRSAAKASAAVHIAEGEGGLAEFWEVMTAALAEHHGAAPVHAADEMRDLMARCPGEIQLHVARVDGAVVAGSVIYVAGPCWHTQYLSASAAGRQVGALDAVIAHGIERARTAGARWFSLGTSNERGGALNEGLYFYKSSFGGGSFVHEFYEL